MLRSGPHHLSLHREHNEELSQPLIQSWMAKRCHKPHAAACCCCAHNFSSSTTSTSFSSKPSCRPAPLRWPAASYRRLLTAFTRKHCRRLEAVSAANNCSRWVSNMIHDFSVDEIEQQLQHRGSRCYTNWPIAEESGD